MALGRQISFEVLFRPSTNQVPVSQGPCSCLGHLMLPIEWDSFGKPSTVWLCLLLFPCLRVRFPRSCCCFPIDLGVMVSSPWTSESFQGGSRLCFKAIVVKPCSQVALGVFHKPSTLTHFGSLISLWQPSEGFRKSWFHYRGNLMSQS